MARNNEQPKKKSFVWMIVLGAILIGVSIVAQIGGKFIPGLEVVAANMGYVTLLGVLVLGGGIALTIVFNIKAKRQAAAMENEDRRDRRPSRHDDYDERRPSRRDDYDERRPSRRDDYNDADDGDENDDIVTLKSADGEDIDFTEIAGIALRGRFYAILQPVELLDGMDDDEALVFEVTRGRDGEDSYQIVEDEDIIDAVFAEYNRLLDEQTR